MLRKVVIIFALFILLGAGGFFGLQAYQKYQDNRIYSVNEKVEFPDFYFQVTKARFKPVNLPLDKDTIAKYGAIDHLENCDKESKEPTYIMLGSLDNTTYAQYGPSDYNICVRRNDSRKAIANYSSDNKQLVVDYRITAKNDVDPKKLKINIIPDSGRKINQQVDSLNANQFFKDGAQEKYAGTPPVYSPEVVEPYIPYYQSDLGGDINRSIERNGYTYTDIRNTEKNVDVKVSYVDKKATPTRIIRLTQE